MKRFFRSTFGKRLTVALCLIALAVFSGIYLPRLFSEDLQWQRMLWCIVVLGSIMGALGELLIGWKGLLGGYGWLIALVLVKFLPDLLPGPWVGPVYGIGLGALLLYSFVFKDRKKGKSTKKKKKKKAAAPVEEPREDLSDPEEDEPLPEGLYFVRFSVSDRNYQLIRCPGQIRAYRVGGELRGVVPELVQDPTKPLRPLDRQDIVFPLDGELSVTFREKHDSRFEEPLLSVRIKTAKRGYTMFPLLPSEEENTRLRQFMEENIPEQRDKTRKKAKNHLWGRTQETTADPEPDPKRVAVLRKVLLGICVLAGLIDIPFLFMDVPYALFAWLSLLPLPLMLVLYFLFPGDITFSDRKNEEKKRASFGVPASLMGMAPALRGMLDFSILNWPRFFVIFGIAMVLLLALFLLLSREWRRIKIVLLGIAFSLAFYCFGLVPLTNYLLDFAEPVRQFAQVEDMHISTSDDSSDQYYLELTLSEGGTQEIKVGKSLYEETSVGDIVTVETHPGAWGIPYAFVQDEA